MSFLMLDSKRATRTDTAGKKLLKNPRDNLFMSIIKVKTKSREDIKVPQLSSEIIRELSLFNRSFYITEIEQKIVRYEREYAVKN